MKSITNLYEKYTGTKAIVFGNGLSVLNFKPIKNCITIGVNDINKFTSPDYHLIVDSIGRFSKERVENIHKSNSNFFVTRFNVGWAFDVNKHYFFNLGTYGKFLNLGLNDKLDFGLDSPYMGALLAYKMGIRQIAFIGVDYTNGHFYDKSDGDHQLVKHNRLNEVKRLYKLLYSNLKSKNTEIYNLNKESIITEIPYLSINDFGKI